MKIGISIASNYQLENFRLGPAYMIERAKAAHEAGLDYLFVGDHHAVPVPYYQNSPMLGRLLAEWNDKPAGALYLLPLWNPVLLAEQVATLACMAKGPFIVQCGLGAGEKQFNAMGADIRKRALAFEQSLNTLRSLWQGDAVSLTGHWNFENARISPLPPEPIAVWIGASAPVAIERAARLGDAWLAEPGISLETAEKNLKIYRGALEKYQKKPAVIAIRRDIYVASSASDARATRDLVESRGYRGFDPQTLMIGETTELAEQMQAFAEIGYTDIIIRNLHPDPSAALASTYRLAEVKECLESGSKNVNPGI